MLFTITGTTQTGYHTGPSSIYTHCLKMNIIVAWRYIQYSWMMLKFTFFQCPEQIWGIQTVRQTVASPTRKDEVVKKGKQCDGLIGVNMDHIINHFLLKATVAIDNCLLISNHGSYWSSVHTEAPDLKERDPDCLGHLYNYWHGLATPAKLLLWIECTWHTICLVLKEFSWVWNNSHR